jgi:hypothetical protein
MSISTIRLRETVVAEAVERAIRECISLLVYEYKDIFDHTVWAVLTKGEQRPQAHDTFAPSTTKVESNGTLTR